MFVWELSGIPLGDDGGGRLDVLMNYGEDAQASANSFKFLNGDRL